MRGGNQAPLFIFGGWEHGRMGLFNRLVLSLVLLVSLIALSGPVLAQYHDPHGAGWFNQGGRTFVQDSKGLWRSYPTPVSSRTGTSGGVNVAGGGTFRPAPTTIKPIAVTAAATVPKATLYQLATPARMLLGGPIGGLLILSSTLPDAMRWANDRWERSHETPACGNDSLFSGAGKVLTREGHKADIMAGYPYMYAGCQMGFVGWTGGENYCGTGNQGLSWTEVYGGVCGGDTQNPTRPLSYVGPNPDFDPSIEWEPATQEEFETWLEDGATPEKHETLFDWLTEQNGGVIPETGTVTITGPSSVEESVTTTTTTANGQTTTTTNTTTNNYTYNNNIIRIEKETTTVIQNPDGTTETVTETESGDASETPLDLQAEVTVNLEFPDFCGWAAPVCSFLDWFQADSPPPEDPPLPTEEHSEVWEQWDSGMPSSGSCPAPHTTEFMGNAISIPFDDFCYGLSTYFRPIFIALAMFAAGFILVGARQ